MQENYQPWVINYQKFDDQKSLADQLKFLIGFAILAPSGHNSQPWKFLVKENTISILAESTRALPKSDPTERQLFLSLGCALENILIAADYYNFDTEVEYQASNSENAVAKIILKKRPDSTISENHLIFSIPKRHTNRNPYEPRMPEESFISWLKNFNRPGFQVNLIRNQEKRHQVADISLEALVETMDDANFREELSQYLKSNFTKSKLGMPGFSHGIPAPVSLIASPLIRRVNMNRLSMKKDEQILKEFTPLFVMISSERDEPKNWLKAGQYYQHMALEAERNNLKTSLLAAPIQKRNFNRELQNLFQMHSYPQILFRIGYCNKVASPTPRLLPHEVTIP